MYQWRLVDPLDTETLRVWDAANGKQLPNAKLLAPFQGEVSQEIKDAVAKAEAGLKDGSIDPPATLK